MSTQEARVYNGRYELVRHLARGGMAEVYQAHDLLLDRQVALKVLFPELSVDRSFVERFRREAQAAASLSHQGIVSIYDWGEEEGTYFIVMEFVDGRPLSQVLKTEGRLTADRAAQIGAGVAAALSAAHRHGVVHRDVKPGNILLDAQGAVKVTDFGIARAGDPSENLTQAGVVMGTATYFSPEQAQGLDTDPRTDIYSLGVVLYEMVTGRPPFSGDSPVSIAYKHVKEEPVPPRQLEPSVPPDLEAVVLAAMAKERDDRYPSADELRADLVRFGRGQTPKAVRVREVLASAGGTTAVPAAVAVATPAPVAADATMAVAPVAVAAPSTSVASGASVATLEPTHKDRTAIFAATTVLLLAVLGVLVYVLIHLFSGSSATGAQTVANVVGQTADVAKNALTDQGYVVALKDQPDDTKTAGTVIAQDPAAGAAAKRGATVTLTVARATGNVEVPSVLNLRQADAEAAIQAAGFVAQVQAVPNKDVSDGFVVTQVPLGKAMAPKGSAVMITVSSGTGLPAVPDVAGQPQAQAVTTLSDAGFRPRVVEELSASQPAGAATRTDPPAGSKLAKGVTTVTLYVSKGAAPTTTSTAAKVTVPDVRNLTQADATAELEALGLTVQAVEASGGTAPGRVRAQNPPPGTKVDPGSTVVITVNKAAATTTTTERATTTTTSAAATTTTL